MYAAEEGVEVFLFPGGRSVWLGWLGLLVSGVFFLKRFRGGGDGKGGGVERLKSGRLGIGLRF